MEFRRQLKACTCKHRNAGEQRQTTAHGPCAETNCTMCRREIWAVRMRPASSPTGASSKRQQGSRKMHMRSAREIWERHKIEATKLQKSRQTLSIRKFTSKVLEVSAVKWLRGKKVGIMGFRPISSSLSLKRRTARKLKALVSTSKIETSLLKQHRLRP